MQLNASKTFKSRTACYPDPKKRTQYIEQEYTEVLNPKAFTESYWNRVLNA